MFARRRLTLPESDDEAAPSSGVSLLGAGIATVKTQCTYSEIAFVLSSAGRHSPHVRVEGALHELGHHQESSDHGQ
jgi:hypothetical protein